MKPTTSRRAGCAFVLIFHGLTVASCSDAARERVDYDCVPSGKPASLVKSHATRSPASVTVTTAVAQRVGTAAWLHRGHIHLEGGRQGDTHARPPSICNAAGRIAEG